MSVQSVPFIILKNCLDFMASFYLLLLISNRGLASKQKNNVKCELHLVRAEFKFVSGETVR